MNKHPEFFASLSPAGQAYFPHLIGYEVTGFMLFYAQATPEEIEDFYQLEKEQQEEIILYHSLSPAGKTYFNALTEKGKKQFKRFYERVSEEKVENFYQLTAEQQKQILRFVLSQRPQSSLKPHDPLGFLWSTIRLPDDDNQK
jgi:hypothetical protein